MKKDRNAGLGRHLAGALSVALWIGCSGCQTFSLTKEEWEKQRRGEMVDRDVGTVVGIFGTIGWFGAGLGQFTAKSLK